MQMLPFPHLECHFGWGMSSPISLYRLFLIHSQVFFSKWGQRIPYVFVGVVASKSTSLNQPRGDHHFLAHAVRLCLFPCESHKTQRSRNVFCIFPAIYICSKHSGKKNALFEMKIVFFLGLYVDLILCEMNVNESFVRFLIRNCLKIVCLRRSSDGLDEW